MAVHRAPRQVTTVGHLTTVHPRRDVRILLKECRSLARAGYRVILIVADGKGAEVDGDVAIVDVGAASSRLDRMTSATRRVLDKALELELDICHLHDPELMPIGLKLKRVGKRVIFDAHEDVPKQLLNKPYLSAWVRRALSWGFGAYESWACRQFDAIVAATPFIRDKFLGMNPLSVDVSNFPLLGELNSDIEWEDKCRQVCYVGGISAIRGVRELVAAMEEVRSGARLQLCGSFSEPDVEADVKQRPGWSAVDELGYLDRAAVREVLGRCVAGLVTLHPLPNYLDSQPIKMFEYMSAGIPVIASDFPLWREIVVGSQCGVCVDPMNPHEIARAIDLLVNDPERARRMGENGRAAIRDRYNWSAEERKLLRLYGELSMETRA